jgi:hypothetical protein
MPWKCPACGIPISHNDAELAPRPGVLYRCHICRLELIVDERNQKLSVAPFPESHESSKKPRQS